MDQFFPVLFDGTTRVEPPKSPEQRYHLSDDITEKAIAWIREQQTVTPIHSPRPMDAKNTDASARRIFVSALRKQRGVLGAHRRVDSQFRDDFHHFDG